MEMSQNEIFEKVVLPLFKPNTANARQPEKLPVAITSDQKDKGLDPERGIKNIYYKSSRSTNDLLNRSVIIGSNGNSDNAEAPSKSTLNRDQDFKIKQDAIKSSVVKQCKRRTSVNIEVPEPLLKVSRSTPVSVIQEFKPEHLIKTDNDSMELGICNGNFDKAEFLLNLEQSVPSNNPSINDTKSRATKHDKPPATTDFKTFTLKKLCSTKPQHSIATDNSPVKLSNDAFNNSFTIGNGSLNKAEQKLAFAIPSVISSSLSYDTKDAVKNVVIKHIKTPVITEVKAPSPKTLCPQQPIIIQDSKEGKDSCEQLREDFKKYPKLESLVMGIVEAYKAGIHSVVSNQDTSIETNDVSVAQDTVNLNANTNETKEKLSENSEITIVNNFNTMGGYFLITSGIKNRKDRTERINECNLVPSLPTGFTESTVQLHVQINDPDSASNEPPSQQVFKVAVKKSTKDIQFLTVNAIDKIKEYIKNKSMNFEEIKEEVSRRKTSLNYDVPELVRLLAYSDSSPEKIVADSGNHLIRQKALLNTRYNNHMVAYHRNYLRELTGILLRPHMYHCICGRKSVINFVNV